MGIPGNLLARAGNHYLRILASNMPCSRYALARQQELNWRTLRKAIRGTRIYRDLGLEQIRTYSDYLQEVPPHDYAFFEPYVETVEKGGRGILFTDDCGCFALSSGTSGYDSKRIPLNEGQMRMLLRAQTWIAARVTQLEKGATDFMRFDRLTFGSVPALYRKGSYDYGYISGILSTRMPKRFRRTTFPSLPVLAMQDWGEKLRELIRETRARDIRMISGMPTYFINVFEQVLRATGVRSIREVWPNLRVFIYAGTPINQYAARIDELVGHEMRYYGYYTSTEASIGIPYEPYCTPAQRYLLNPDLLVSFTTPGESEVTGIMDVVCGKPYMINIGTPNGLVQYEMKDLVEFQDVQGNLVFQFIGRDGEAMNLAAEKVTHSELLQSLDEARTCIAGEVRHFFVAPVINSTGIPAYGWTLFVDRPLAVDLRVVAEALDRALQRHNLDYRDCRSVGVIGAPTAATNDTSTLEGYFKRNRGRGQFKLRTTFRTSEDFAQFMKAQFGDQIAS
jgi:hypothetical protein